MKQNSYQLGIFSWFGYRLHMARRAKLIKDAGFTITSIWWGDEEKENTGSLHDLPAIIRDTGLAIDNIHVPFQDCANLAADNPSVRQKIIDRHIAWLSDCARHKIPIMVMHTCPEQDNPPPPNKYILDSLAQILKHAENLNITIAIENTRRQDHIDFVFSKINSRKLAICYDSSHDVLWSDRPFEILAKYADRLVTVHLSDNDGLEDRHWLPNQGNIDWQKLAKAFPHRTYEGPLMLEILPKDAAVPPETYLQQAYESICFAAKLLAPKNQKPGTRVI